MRKRTLERLTVGGFGLCVLGIVICIFTSLGSSSSCDPTCTIPTGLIVGLILGYLIFMGGMVLQIIAWIGSLIAQAKRQQWAWFVCTLVFGILCMWVYLFVVPETPEPEPAAVLPAYPAMQAYTPGQPYYAPMHMQHVNPEQPSYLYQSQPQSHTEQSIEFEQPQE